jgi:hypothetical protein
VNYKWTDEPVRRLIDDVFYRFDEAYAKHSALVTAPDFAVALRMAAFHPAECPLSGTSNGWDGSIA